MVETINTEEGKVTLDWSKQGPYAVTVEWKKDISAEDIATAEGFINEFVKAINDVPEGNDVKMPEVIAALTIRHS